jgi:lipoprotein
LINSAQKYEKTTNYAILVSVTSCGLHRLFSRGEIGGGELGRGRRREKM